MADAQNTHDVVMLPGSGTTMIEAIFRSFWMFATKFSFASMGSMASVPLRCYTLGIAAYAVYQTLGGYAPVPFEMPSRPTHHYASLFVHAETTFGIRNPYDELKISREYGLISVVDSMSAFGGTPVSGQCDRFDVLITEQ